MTLGTSIDTPAAVGAVVRAQRQDRGLPPQALADTNAVSRKCLIDLEAGHERAELGKTLAILTSLGLSMEATDPIPHGSDHDPACRTVPKPSQN